MTNNQTVYKLQPLAVLDAVAGLLIICDADDPGTIDDFAMAFRHFESVLAAPEQALCRRMSAKLESALLTENPENIRAALYLASQVIMALQTVLRDGRTLEEIDMTEIELGLGNDKDAKKVVSQTPVVSKETGEANEKEKPEPEPDGGESVTGPGPLLKKETVKTNAVKKEGAAMEQNTARKTTAGPAAERNLTGKYLTFKLGAEEYGLEILKVQEIIKMMDITKVPRTPDFIRGVVNLRGKVIPVVDLRRKFAMPDVETTEKTCVIVVQVLRGGARITMSVIVDEVYEVLDVTEDQIEPSPEFGTAVKTDFILGMGKIGKRVVMLLDVDQVLSSTEMSTVADVAGNAVNKT